MFENLMSWLFPKGLKARDLGLPTAAVLLMVFIGAFTTRIFQQQDHDGDMIELVGSQRMLLQSFYREASHPQPDEKKLQELSNLMLQSYRSLRYGGYLKHPAKSDRWFLVTPLERVEHQKILESQISALEQLRELKQVSEEDSGARVIEDSLSRAQAIVEIYVHESKSRLRILIYSILGLTGFLGILGLLLSRMIFERRLQMAAVTRAKDEAVKASEAKTQFLANMSHEIRTPLNAIIGMTDILQSTTLTSEQSRFVKTLRRAGDTLLSLINDILDLSKIESGQIELNEHPLDVLELVDRLTEMFAFRAHQKGLELNSYIAPEVPTFIVADELRLRQVLTNLLGNAVKFTSSGEICLRLEVDFDSEMKNDHLYLKFSVADTGIGIPESKLQSIFESFIQADQSIAHEYGGTGLGLAICKRLVRLMNGSLSVKSQPGAGSTFVVTVPVFKSQQLSQVAPVLEHFQNKRILVVDDNETNRLIVRKYLVELTAQLDEAKSGFEALELLKKAKRQDWHYDLILMDYRMPGLNGIEVAAKILHEKLANGTIVMLLTSDGVRSDLGKLSDLGITEYMVKPIRKREFISAVTKIFGSELTEGQKIDPQEASAIDVSGDGRKILIVDDVEDNRFVASTYLQAAGFSVEEASTGEFAVELRKSKNYHMILMDIRMSPMDGYTATKKIRQWETENSQARVPIVALSAQALKQEIDQALFSGCDSYLIKPIRQDQLMVAVSKFALPTSVDEAIVVRLDGLLKGRLPNYLQKLQNDLNSIDLSASPNFDQIARLGHNISGTAGMYGLNGLSHLAHELDLSSQKADPSKVEALRKQMLAYISRIKWAE